MADTSPPKIQCDQAPLVVRWLWCATGVVLLLLVATPFVLVAARVRQQQRLESLCANPRVYSQWKSEAVPGSLKWLPKWLQNAFYERLDWLSLHEDGDREVFMTILRESRGISTVTMNGVPHGALRLLAERHQPASLIINTSEITADDALHLSRLRSLEKLQLSLSDVRATNDWSWLKRLPTTAELEVGEYSHPHYLTDRDVRALATCPQLTYVNAEMKDVSGEALGELVRNPGLTTLYLKGEFHIKMPAGASGNPALTHIGLQSRVLEDDSLEWIFHLPRLSILEVVSERVRWDFEGKTWPSSVDLINLNCPRMDDKSLRVLCTAVGLRTLAVRSGKFSEDGLRHITGLPDLRSIHFGDTRTLQDREIRQLASSPRALELSFGIHSTGEHDSSVLTDETKRFLHVLVPYLKAGRGLREITVGCATVGYAKMLSNPNDLGSPPNPEYTHDNVEQIFLERVKR